MLPNGSHKGKLEIWTMTSSKFERFDNKSLKVQNQAFKCYLTTLVGSGDILSPIPLIFEARVIARRQDKRKFCQNNTS